MQQHSFKLTEKVPNKMLAAQKDQERDKTVSNSQWVQFMAQVFILMIQVGYIDIHTHTQYDWMKWCFLQSQVDKQHKKKPKRNIQVYDRMCR